MPAQVDTAREIGPGRDAYLRLIEDIRGGVLSPGDRLTEADLAARFGISRTPVREALRALEADGLVCHVPRVGATVRVLDYGEVTELYEMRTVLEGTAARLAARVASDVEIAELQAISDEMAAALDDLPRLYRLNRQFHRTLLSAARNRFLVSAVAGLEKTLLILGPSTMHDPGRAAAAQAEHAAILQAIGARDGAGAEQRMKLHIQAAHTVRLRQLRGIAERAAPGQVGGDLM